MISLVNESIKTSASIAPLKLDYETLTLFLFILPQWTEGKEKSEEYVETKTHKQRSANDVDCV